MKIAFVNDTFVGGRGVDQVIYEIAKRLGKRHDVTVICGKSKIQGKSFKVKELGFERLMSGTGRDFFLYSKFKRINEACKGFDIINVHHSTLNLALLNIENVVTTYHGSPFVFEAEKNPLRASARYMINKMGVFSLNKNKKIIAISEYMKSVLKKNMIQENKIEVIRNGVDKAVFKPSWKDKNYMLYVGRHEPHKKIEELIRISKATNFDLKIVGSGTQTEKLIKLSKKIKAPVKFFGNVSRKKLIKLYQECSFFVSASRWEGFGLIFLEAAACGKPAAAYNVCSLPEVIKNGKTGYLARDFKELMENSKRLIENPRERKRLGKGALKFSGGFGWDKISREYERLFKSL